MTAESIQPGAKVFLRACSGAGDPGTVVHQERGKLVVYWPDLDYWSRHPEASLELAELQTEGSAQ